MKNNRRRARARGLVRAPASSQAARDAAAVKKQMQEKKAGVAASYRITALCFTRAPRNFSPPPCGYAPPPAHAAPDIAEPGGSGKKAGVVVWRPYLANSMPLAGLIVSSQIDRNDSGCGSERIALYASGIWLA